MIALLCVLAAQEDVVLYPREIRLHGPASRQTLLLERTRGTTAVGPADGAAYASSDLRVVVIENGAAVPVGDGTATITARAGGRTSTSPVKVTDMGRPFARSFRNHVQPVLARYGCSSGACHGAAAGKNGFKLSLRGYDEEGDHKALTRHALGRRVDLEDPGRSLLLLKATGAVAHKGGVRFAPSSREYDVLGEWIAAGCPPPRADDPRVSRIEVLPPHAELKPGQDQPVLVLAHFTDGSVFDATPWAKYTGSDSSVAVPDEAGRVKVTGNGEGAITAWYLQKIAVASITVPYANQVPAEVFAKAPRANFIDDLVLAKLKELDLPPSPPCSDAEFLRRAFLDATGTLPTADEARAFLADPAPDKRDRLIEALLARPEYVDYWTYKWSDLLLVSSRTLSKPAMWAYFAWVRNRVAANTPWDAVVRELVTATGGSMETGAAAFYLLHDDPTEMAENVSQAFLGMSIQCAKCHNHPMEKWTNDQYYAFANLFSRVRHKATPRAGNAVVFAASEGELIQPVSGRPQPPTPLDGTPVAFDAPGDRRHALADWLVSKDNAYFARSIVNRVWANYMGVGLVEAVDDMRKTNPASNEKLLDALAAHLAEAKFDLKALTRAILRSQAYQRSSRPLPGNAGDKRFYARFYPRRLMAEIALDALSQATGAPTTFVEDLRNANQKGGALPSGLRALQLPDSKTDSYFLKAFGRADRIQTCECERSNAPSMSQALHLSNGDTLNEKLRAKGNRIEKLLASSPETIVEEAYLASVSRLPTDAERRKILDVLAGAKETERREAIEDLFWGLLSSREFLFNH
ncbi:MAG TPA: DUF1549 and DUF1553 domain-containing protein [Planctomycetota bacterium]